MLDGAQILSHVPMYFFPPKLNENLHCVLQSDLTQILEYMEEACHVT